MSFSVDGSLLVAAVQHNGGAMFILTVPSDASGLLNGTGKLELVIIYVMHNISMSIFWAIIYLKTALNFRM